jgi:hypothetical protein
MMNKLFIFLKIISRLYFDSFTLLVINRGRDLVHLSTLVGRFSLVGLILFNIYFSAKGG